MPNSPSSSSVIPTGERALQVLALVARHGSSLTARELATQAKLPLSSLYRHLASLKKWGLVQEHGQSGLYQPGPLSLQLAWGFDHHSYLMQVAHAEMVSLVEKSGESVGLLVYLNGQIICLDMLESQQALRCSFSKGRANSVVHGASAKALLAHLPGALLAAILAEHPTEAQYLPAQLEQCRQQGYVVSVGEVDADVWGVSAPIFSSKKRVECTISLMAPNARAQLREPELIELTLAAAARIGRQLSDF
ncbi:IclR family transcriptional regulator [Solimicrobium silvestre]|uniref:Transcriptional regulator n=1 Tax=Solimicrobium silvestre TaxID=2099400 RepID=A0A2S9GZS4_9BURK|nr:IclR family transcriptional regulator [Solimicrobium silvestre]PRC93203.1 Transcriptional regulator [Solimicrobium silvestre]